MAKQVSIFYQKTDPFAGWIRFKDVLDMDEAPDGSTKRERLSELLIKYPDSDYHLFPLDTEVDPETQKFDTATSTLVALDPADITPNAQAILDEAQKALDIIDSLPSWAAIESSFDSIRTDGAAATTIAALKAALGRFLDLEEKHARITYWLAKNSRT